MCFFEKRLVRFISLFTLVFIGTVSLSLSVVGPVLSSPVKPENKALQPLLQGTQIATSTLQSEAITPTLSIQGTPTPTATVVLSGESSPDNLSLEDTSIYSFSLEALGFTSDTTLVSPGGTINYFFRVPENWTIEGDGLFNLDLSFVYRQIGSDDLPQYFGDITIRLDNEILTIVPVEEISLNHRQIQISLPASILNTPDQIGHTIRVEFNSQSLLCNISHEAKLIIHSSTTIVTFNYRENPIQPDLAKYPLPFYQRAFEPDLLRFVLPEKITENTLTNVAGVVAKLGDLTSNNLVISATTDVDFNGLILDANFDEHLLVIGSPQENTLISFLNESTQLPITLHQQTLAMRSEGPTLTASGDTVTYSFIITNTTNQPADLSIVSTLSHQVASFECEDCRQSDNSSNDIIWDNIQLDPDDTLVLPLMLKVTDELTGTYFENTITLIDADLGPLNADTITTNVVADLVEENEQQSSQTNTGDYFFVREGRAIAKTDGIIQEVTSPWNNSRAVLVLTGLDDKSINKAAQAMSSETRFPGMNGSFALVKDTLPITSTEPLTPAVESTFADLGESDVILQGGGSQTFNLSFDIPDGTTLTDDAFLDLFFSHSSLLNYQNSSLTVLLNRDPIGSIQLSEDTVNNGQLNLNLANARVNSQSQNRLVIQADLFLDDANCVGNSPDQAWLVVKDSSKLFLPNEKNFGFTSGLDDFPYPFNKTPTLTDVLFALPEAPTIEEQTDLLRLIANLGSAVGENFMFPQVMISEASLVDSFENYHIIALGRPTRNTIIEQINDFLPQPFVPGSDEIQQRLDRVTFRVPADLDLGVIELIPSIWSETHTILAISGTTDTGVQWALQRLLTNSNALGRSDLALIKENQIESVDTRGVSKNDIAKAVATVVPELSPVPTETATASPLFTSTPSATLSQTPSQNSRPIWLIPLVVVNGLLVIVILGLAFWQTRRKRT